MKTFYSKELCANKLMFNGAAIPFECQPSNTGVIQLDDGADAALVAYLKDCITKRKGGVRAIDAATYEAIKKNKIGRVSAAFSPKARLQVLKGPQLFGKPREVGAAVAAVKSGVRNGATADNSDPPPPIEPFVPNRGRVLNDENKPVTQ